MELLLGIVIVVTCWMVVRIIRSSKNQEGYKRWRAGNYASENPMPKKKQVVRFPKVFLVRESELPVRGGSMTELSGGVPICWQPKNPD